MISTLINSKGTGRANEFRRVDEYVYFLWFGSAKLGKLSAGQSTPDEVDAVPAESDIDDDSDASDADIVDEGAKSGNSGIGIRFVRSSDGGV